MRTEIYVTELILAGYGRLFWLFWSCILLGYHHLSLDSLGNQCLYFPLLTMLLMDSLPWILSSLSLLHTLIKFPIYSLMIRRRLLGSMAVPGWLLTLYPRYHLNLLRRSSPSHSVHMAYSTCSVFGVYAELVPCFQGRVSALFPPSASFLR